VGASTAAALLREKAGECNPHKTRGRHAWFSSVVLCAANVKVAAGPAKAIGFPTAHEGSQTDDSGHQTKATGSRCTSSSQQTDGQADGLQLIEPLLASDVELVLASRSRPSYDAAVRSRPELRAAAFAECDIDDGASLQAALRGADLVVHAAGPFQRKTTCAVLEAAIAARVPYVGAPCCSIRPL
jgi:Saccharopine dehydrogenase NADP binding domain